MVCRSEEELKAGVKSVLARYHRQNILLWFIFIMQLVTVVIFLLIRSHISENAKDLNFVPRDDAKASRETTTQ